jgi:hypothetical protein
MTTTDLAMEVIQERGNAVDMLEALGVHLDEMPVLRPGLDYRNKHLYVTLPIDRDETKTVKSGKATKEVTQRVTATIAIRSAGPDDDGPAVFLYDDDSVRAQGFRFPQSFVQELVNRWPTNSMHDYLARDHDPVDPATLYDRIRQVYRDHVEYPDDIYYSLVPLFIMGSYVFRIFPATGYIHFNGTAASGKSQNLRILQALGLNTVWASNMSTASLFRQVAGCPGIICVDEAESFESERGQELRQILLSGYNDGSTVTRTERGANEKFVVVRYEAYAPKVLASINPLDSTLASRCIVVPMAPAIRTIPEFDATDARWADIRADLYVWAMTHVNELADLRDHWFREKRHEKAPGIKSRAWEIAMQYFILGDHVGGDELVDQLRVFFDNYFAKAAKTREDNDRQYTLLKALPRVMSEVAPHPDFFYTLKEIHTIAVSFIEEDAREYYKTRTVARHLTSLGFKETRTAKGGKQIQLLEGQVRRAFEQRHVTPFPEDEEWLSGTRSYQDTTPPSAPAQAVPVDQDDWLDDEG